MSGSETKSGNNVDQFRIAHARSIHDDQLKHTFALLPLVSAFGVEALKSAVLINGGTAGALLAFVGQKGIISQPELSSSLRVFAVGLLLGAIATGLAYVAQLCYTTGSQHYERLWEYPFIKYPPIHHRWNRVGIFFHVISVVLVILSYSSAVYGFYTAGQKFPI